MLGGADYCGAVINDGGWGGLFLPDVFSPGEEGTGVEIVEVVVVGVGFALEGNVAVSGEGITMDDDADDPLYAVPQKEKHEEHLTLLMRVDVLVIENDGTHLSAREDEAADVDGVEVLEE